MFRLAHLGHLRVSSSWLFRKGRDLSHSRSLPCPPSRQYSLPAFLRQRPHRPSASAFALHSPFPAQHPKEPAPHVALPYKAPCAGFPSPSGWRPSSTRSRGSAGPALPPPSPHFLHCSQRGPLSLPQAGQSYSCLRAFALLFVIASYSPLTSPSETFPVRRAQTTLALPPQGPRVVPQSAYPHRPCRVSLSLPPVILASRGQVCILTALVSQVPGPGLGPQ